MGSREKTFFHLRMKNKEDDLFVIRQKIINKLSILSNLQTIMKNREQLLNDINIHITKLETLIISAQAYLKEFGEDKINISNSRRELSNMIIEKKNIREMYDDVIGEISKINNEIFELRCELKNAKNMCLKKTLSKHNTDKLSTSDVKMGPNRAIDYLHVIYS